MLPSTRHLQDAKTARSSLPQRKLFVACLVLSQSLVFAQSDLPESEATGVPSGSYNFFRWNDDFSYLDDRDRRIGVEYLKRVPLFGQPRVRLSIGGDYRFRSESFDNPFFGLRDVDDFSSLQHRFMLQGNLEVDNSIRLFTQLSVLREDGRPGGSLATDESDLDFQQGFIDIGPRVRGESPVFARIGRQELFLGSGRFYSEREGTNARRSFDALKLDLSHEQARFQAFVGRPVDLRDGVFDDTSNEGELTWGVYGTYAFGEERPSVDVYYFGRNADSQTWAQGTADELRHTIGARVSGQRDVFFYDVEAAYQFGSFGGGDISAWGVASDIGIVLHDAAWRPRFGVRTNIASGDRDPADADLQSFNPLYPKLAYFSDDATYAPVNALDVHPYVEFEPTDGVRLEFGADAIFRLDGDDAFYAAGPSVLVGPGGDDLELSTILLRAKAEWDIGPHVSLLLSLVHGTEGEVVRNAGGEPLSYALFQVTARF